MTEQRSNGFETEITPIDGWFVTARHPLVQQRFFAAIDSVGHLCWTDDPSRAEQFPMQEDAERFARFSCPDEDWIVAR